MIDKILLFPYWLTLKLRHFMYDHGMKKVHVADVPTICVGNITVGGTGKTPHTEMIVRLLSQDSFWGSRNIAVLSRGYKRRTKGFQQVVCEGSARQFGDEPLQIKRKFPSVTVAVDKSRKQGCGFLSDPEQVQTSKKARKCLHKDFPKADLIILDDAFQHRAVKPSVSIVLVDYNRPTFEDHLMPLGKLRDLRERIGAADIVIVSKCPRFIDPWERSKWTEALKIRKDQHIFFTTIGYDQSQAIFPEGDPRYLYTHKLILFSGIANDRPFRNYLTDSYKIIRHFDFPDHHKFSKADIATIRRAADAFPTSVVMTTEKDCQRIRDCKSIPDNLKKRMFYAPIKVNFYSEMEQEEFAATLNSYLK